MNTAVTDAETRESANKEPIVTITRNNTSITILGTAHVSRASAEKVLELIQTGEYDAVAVELCPSRHNAIINPDSLAQMDLFKVLKDGKIPMVSASLALGAYQQRLADQFNIKPGAEMRVAIEQAEQAKLPVLLIDREIGTTLKRVYRNIPWWRRMTLVSGLVGSVLSREQVSETEIEKLKEGDMLETTFSQFADEAKDLFMPLIDERDRYMAAHLENATNKDYKHVLAVVGAGHVKGMVNYLNEGQHFSEKVIEDLDQVPPPSILPKIIPWVIVLLIFTGFFIGFSRSPDLGWQLVTDWVLINGGLAALGALIAGAHLITIVGAFIAAPITSLNPTIGAGMVTAAIEIFMRKPTVGDFGRLRQDTTKLSGWWKNRVTRVFLVFMLSTFGSAVGTYLAGFKIFGQLHAAGL